MPHDSTGPESEIADRILLLAGRASLSVPLARRSRYDGYTVYRPNGSRVEAIKIFDSIEIFGERKVARVCQEDFSKATIVYDDGLEVTYALVKSRSAPMMLVSTNTPIAGRIRLDTRHLYDNLPFHKTYGLTGQGVSYAVDFEKVNADRAASEYDLRIRYSIGFSKGATVVGRDEWLRLYNAFDDQRADHPSEHYVYVPLQFADTSEIAVSLSGRAMTRKLEPAGALVFSRESAYRFASMQLRSSFVALRGRQVSLSAGYPWFFQMWARDAAISMGGLFALDMPEAERVLFSLLESSSESSIAHTDSLRSADGLPFLFMRVLERFDSLSSSRRRMVRDRLRDYLGLLEREYRDGALFFNGPLETWMDTGDGFRAGFSVEIQCLMLRMYELAERCGIRDLRLSRDEIGDAIRTQFFDSTNGRLVDHLSRDWEAYAYDTVNVFLAAYIAPEILTREEWCVVFEHALAELSNGPPGILSSLSSGSPLFQAHHTGLDNVSYHRGDSWYFMNNIAAIVLSRTDAERFATQIDGIVAASVRDCLEQGAIGACSEISSACEQRSFGCYAQTWSAATLVELFAHHPELLR